MTGKERMERWMAAAKRYAGAVEILARSLLVADPIRRPGPSATVADPGPETPEHELGVQLSEVYGAWRQVAESPVGRWEDQRDALLQVKALLPRLSAIEQSYQSRTDGRAALLRRNLEPIFRQFEAATKEAEKARVLVEPEPTPEPGPSLGPEIEPGITFAPPEEADEDEMGEDGPAGLSAPVSPDPRNTSRTNVSTTLGPAVKAKVPGGLTVADHRPEGIIERRPRTQPIQGVVLYATKSLNVKDAVASLANQRRGVHYLVDRDGTIHHLASESEVVAHSPKGTLLQEATPTDGVTVAVAFVNAGHAREGVKSGPLWIRTEGATWELFDWPQLEAAAELVAQILERAKLAPTVAVWPGDKVNPEVTNNPGPAFPTRHFFDLLLRRLKAGPAPKGKPSTGSRVTDDSWAVPLLLIAAFGLGVALDVHKASSSPSSAPVKE